MSNVSDRHTIETLDKKSKALTGQRLARIIAKADKNGMYQSANLTVSKCVSIPKLTIADFTPDHINALMPHLVSMIQDRQDDVIRDKIITEGITSIADADISIDACIKFMESNAGSGRLSTEYLQEWFTEVYADASYEFIGALCKFGDDPNQYTEDQLNVIEQKSNVLRDMFAGFASGKYMPDMPKCKAMLKFGEFVGADNQDARMQSYIARAQKQLDKLIAETSADALGF
jgi:hypothetical protein